MKNSVYLISHDDGTSKGQAIGTPTVKELVAILSKFPEDYRVSCCGADCFIHLFEGVKYITIDNEQYLN